MTSCLLVVTHRLYVSFLGDVDIYLVATIAHFADFCVSIIYLYSRRNGQILLLNKIFTAAGNTTEGPM